MSIPANCDNGLRRVCMTEKWYQSPRPGDWVNKFIGADAFCNLACEQPRCNFDKYKLCMDNTKKPLWDPQTNIDCVNSAGGCVWTGY